MPDRGPDRSPWGIRFDEPLAAVAGLTCLVLLAVAVVWAQPARPNAGVAGATSRPAAAVPASPGTAPSSDPSPATAAPTTPEASPRVPPAGPRLDVTGQVIHPWVDPLGEVRAQVLVEVTNAGDAPGYLVPGETTYRVTSPDGDTVAGSRFAHVFPRLVPPGERAWLIDTISATFTEPAALAELEIELAETAAPPDDREAAGRLLVQDVEWGTAASGGIEATGVVENAGSTAVGRVAVAVILFGQNGQMLAGVYDVEDAGGLAPGERAEFATDYPGTAPLEAASVSRAEAVAVALPD